MKRKVQNGESAILSWVAPYIPAIKHVIYHTNNTCITHKILEVDVRNGQSTLSKLKYNYLTKPYNSTNITFEIKNVTLVDAGYYNGEAQKDDATLCGGVVLIVYGEYKQ